MEANKAGFLPEPIVTIEREGDDESGPIVSAYLELRQDLKAVRTIQPNPSVLVYFLLAADGLPVGISFHEPVSGTVVCQIVHTLIEGADGPEGVDRHARHEFIRASDMASVMRGIEKTIEDFQPA